MGSHVQLVPFLRQLGSGSNPVLSPPPTPCYIPLCRGLLLHTSVASARYGHAPGKRLVARVLVASQDILPHYVAESPPKPVRNSAFFVHSQWPRHNCKHNAWPLGQAQRRFRLRHCQASTEGKACREPLTRPACGSAKRQAPPGSRQPANHRRALKSAYYITILIWHEITDYSDYCNAKRAVCRSPSQCVARWLVHHSDHARRVILRRKESDFGNFCMLQHAGP